MPRRRSPARRRYDDDYDYYPRYGGYGRRRGCLGSLQHFFQNALITFLIGLGSILFFLIILLIAFNFTLFIEILVYALYVVAGLAAIGIIYLIVRMFTAMSRRISTARAEKAKSLQENERVRLAQVKIEHEQEQLYERRAKRGREEYATQQPYSAPRAARPTVNFQEQRYAQEHYSQEYLVRRLPEPDLEEELEPEIVIPNMPTKGQVFLYRDYERLLQPGEFLAGIRKDGSAHVAKWADYKVCIILGTSDSGKSNTATEKCVCGVRGGGWLVVCDPGAEKPDSLTRRILPLAEALMPGTIFAMEHPDCMNNIRAVSEEYDRRRRGSDMSIPIFLIIDEFNRLMRDGSIAKELNKLIETFAQEVRGYNINVILCTQRVTGLAAIRNSVISCIAHRSQPSESSKIIPARFAKYTNELAKGQTFVHDENGNVFALQQTLIETQDVQALADAWQQRSRRSRAPRPTQQGMQSASPLPQVPQPRRVTQQPGNIPGNIPPQRRTTQQPGNQPGGIPGNIPQRRTTQQPGNQPTNIPGNIPQRRTTQQPGNRPDLPASATWEQVNIPQPVPRAPIPPQAPGSQSRQRQRPDPATDELAPRTISPDPFDALAALRDQRQHKKNIPRNN